MALGAAALAAAAVALGAAALAAAALVTGAGFALGVVTGAGLIRGAGLMVGGMLVVEDMLLFEGMLVVEDMLLFEGMLVVEDMLLFEDRVVLDTISSQCVGNAGGAYPAAPIAAVILYVLPSKLTTSSTVYVLKLSKSATVAVDCPPRRVRLLRIFYNYAIKYYFIQTHSLFSGDEIPDDVCYGAFCAAAHQRAF